jgi:hypothetical protein
MNVCDLCSEEGPLTWRTNEHGMVERLCSGCWQWADYWSSLTEAQRAKIDASIVSHLNDPYRSAESDLDTTT